MTAHSSSMHGSFDLYGRLLPSDDLCFLLGDTTSAYNSAYLEGVQSGGVDSMHSFPTHAQAMQCASTSVTLPADIVSHPMELSGPGPQA